MPKFASARSSAQDRGTQMTLVAAWKKAASGEKKATPAGAAADGRARPPTEQPATQRTAAHTTVCLASPVGAAAGAPPPAEQRPAAKRAAAETVCLDSSDDDDEDLPLCHKLQSKIGGAAPQARGATPKRPRLENPHGTAHDAPAQVKSAGGKGCREEHVEHVQAGASAQSAKLKVAAADYAVSQSSKRDAMEEVWKNLASVFSLSSFRPLQRQAIEGVVRGGDVMVCLATGGGKSLCYQLPATVLPGITVVISPLIALMEDQVQACRDKGIQVDLLNSTLTAKEVAAIYARLAPSLSSSTKGGERPLGFSGADPATRPPKIKMLYVTPEAISGGKLLSVLTHLHKHGYLSLFAIDEAHCISSWGHDFRPAFRRLDTLKKTFDKVPVIALTATATQRVRDDIVKTLQLKTPQILLATFNRPNISYEIRYKRHLPHEDVEADIVRFLSSRKQECGIIYCHKKVDCENIAGVLQRQGFSAACYHGGMKPDARAELLQRWTNNVTRIVVATVAFGMGIDKGDVRFVIHHSIPKSMENFYQESGRAGRDGAPSASVMYYALEDKQLHEFLMEKEHEARHNREQVFFL